MLISHSIFFVLLVLLIFVIINHDLSGQVLNHLKLGDYLRSKVTSLKELQNGDLNGDPKISSLAQLANAMQALNKLVISGIVDKPCNFYMLCLYCFSMMSLFD